MTDHANRRLLGTRGVGGGTHDAQPLSRQGRAVEGEIDRVRAGGSRGAGRRRSSGLRRVHARIDLLHRIHEALAAGGDMVELPVLLLLFDPAVEHGLGACRIGRQLGTRAAVQRGHQALAGGGQLADMAGRDGPVAQLLGQHKLVFRGGKALLRPGHRIGPVVHLVGLVHRQLAIFIGQRDVEGGRAGRLRGADPVDIRGAARGDQQGGCPGEQEFNG